MVDEFSSFARLPKPLFRGEDPIDLAFTAVFVVVLILRSVAFSL